ncbi:MAG: DnaJ domain-containing protein [Bacteroidales bacterium]|nr:DnaJ domain-containing protein [Bacteroidales bacterium]
MLLENTPLYIEFGSETLEILFPVLFGLVFILLMYLGIKSKYGKDSELRNTSDSQLPVYLFRAHVARFIASTGHSFNEIKDMYSEYLKKFAFVYGVEQKYELSQLLYLTDNKINVEHTIRKGRKESHKKRLMILFLLFNISVRTGKLSDNDRFYLDKVYKDLGLSYSVYSKIKSTYIKDKQKNTNKRFQDISVSSYKLQKAYQILNLTSGASFKEVKYAYRKMAKKYHPDVYKKHDTKSKEFAVKMFNEISQAYEIIKEHNAAKLQTD